MKEINIAKMILSKRREKGITQDELAAYIGVSKASVSKWETEQNFPDITFLPQLATYFNISVDELIGYSPQMTKEDIKKLYHRLSSEFSSQSFDEVLAEVRAIIKKYYSCFPLLLQMAVLLINHYGLAKEKDDQKMLLHEIIGICIRTKTESEDIWLSQQANSIEALCHMALKQPLEVVELLDGTIKPISGDEVILAIAYQMMGNIQKSKEVLQVSTYQHLLILTSNLISYLNFYVNESDKFEEILQRILSISKVFDLDQLHPNMALQIYFSASQCYATQGDLQKSLDMLSKYADICIYHYFPFSLHGDDFFDCMDEWFNQLDLGAKPPRDEWVIKESMIQSVVTNPAFSVLAEHPGYKRIIEKMGTKLEIKIKKESQK
ncbi:MAG: helix-turn-helix transcriptional regulator [Anaerolineaceae bacterium]|nr:helix-turn-helix transcriptional regulator [Anaerolineaceae bacterium]